MPCVLTRQPLKFYTDTNSFHFDRLCYNIDIMQEQSRYAVGIDVGTTTVRCVVGHIDPVTGAPTIVGVGRAASSGMRKGAVINLAGPAHAIDAALGDAERMGGHEINEATMSINGSHIMSTRADGMIAVGSLEHEINDSDLRRIEDVATTGKIPANREVLEIVPLSYTLDGQGGIKNPLGMNGMRLEISANVVSAMTPYVASLQKTTEMATVIPNAIVPSVMAAAKSVLNESQLESGVAVIDMGGATTGVAIFEDSDLQYVGIVPYGGMHVTNDLAIGLKVDPEIAEKVKLAYASAVVRGETSDVSIKHDKEVMVFSEHEVKEIIDARLEETFEAVQKELKKAGRDGQLPSGVVLVGGAAQMRGVAELVKAQLGLAVRIGKPGGYGGVADGVESSSFAAAVGLMLIDSESAEHAKSGHSSKGSGGSHTVKKVSGILSNLFNRYKS